MQFAITVKPIFGGSGFDVERLNELLQKGYTVNNAYASTDNSLLVILDEPKSESN